MARNLSNTYGFYHKNNLEAVDAGGKLGRSLIHAGVEYTSCTIYPNDARQATNISLEQLFQHMETTNEMPYIKHNQGMRLESMYKLKVKGYSTTGRPVPVLPVNIILRESKTHGRQHTISTYGMYKNATIHGTHARERYTCAYASRADRRVSMSARRSFVNTWTSPSFPRSKSRCSRPTTSYLRTLRSPTKTWRFTTSTTGGRSNNDTFDHVDVLKGMRDVFVLVTTETTSKSTNTAA